MDFSITYFSHYMAPSPSSLLPPPTLHTYTTHQHTHKRLLMTQKEGMVSRNVSQNNIRAGLLVSELQDTAGRGGRTDSYVQLTIVGGG